MEDRPPWGALFVLFVAVALIGGGAWMAYDWTVSEPPTTTILVTTTALSIADQAIDACTGLIDGYVEYATRVAGPPPDGWVESEIADCVPVTLPLIEDGTSQFTDYCTGWQRGQEVARDTAGVALDFTACPTTSGGPPAVKQ